MSKQINPHKVARFIRNPSGHFVVCSSFVPNEIFVSKHDGQWHVGHRYDGRGTGRMFNPLSFEVASERGGYRIEPVKTFIAAANIARALHSAYLAA